MVWALSDMVTENLSWDTVFKELLVQHMQVSKYMLELVRKRINSREFINTYGQLYEVMKSLYQTGKINKFGWDLHTENVMQRSNGQLVIIVPFGLRYKKDKIMLTVTEAAQTKITDILAEENNTSLKLRMYVQGGDVLE
jgi:hypothetical protein